MRLIDADALKKVLEVAPYNDIDDLTRTERLIDDAPTIESQPNSCILMEFGKCLYKETGCSDCYIKERIRRALDEKCYEIGHADGARLGYEKGRKDARPKGKWKSIDAFVVKCSVCGVESFATPFCPRCGADMRGDA